MLATQCSFCLHENTPGARYCAECGSPMHLKVCPNTQCGKVSDVNATVCEFCGEPFPRITLVAKGTSSAEAPAGSLAQGAGPVTAANDKPRLPAWPMIMVAIVAGGLPLLWANRSKLPTPKTWQASPSDTTNAVAASPAPVAPAKVSAPGASPPASALTSNPSTPAAPVAAKKTVKAPPQKTSAPRPCTAAMAALGLCVPKQGK